jgi:PEP-CTERM motif-containing protein
MLFPPYGLTNDNYYTLPGVTGTLTERISSTVPEPPPLSLMLIGLGSLGLVLLMRKRAALRHPRPLERIAHAYIADATEHPPLPAPNVLPNAPQDFFLWRTLLIKPSNAFL